MRKHNMKKLLLATLLAGLATTASAQVVVSGKLGTTIDRTEVGARTTNGFLNDPTSNFAITATEKSGPFAFRAVVETSLFGNTETLGSETRLGDRQRTLGLGYQNLGVDFGRNVHSHFLNVTTHDPFSTVYGSVAGDIHPLHGLRISNGIFAHAHVAKTAHVNFEKTYGEAVETRVMAGSASLGPVKATVSHFEKGVDKSLVISAGADIAGNKLTATYSDNEGTVNHKGMTVNAMRDVGPWTLKASYGKTSTEVKAYSLGAVYNFSKRTEVGVAYRNVDRAAVASIGDINQIGLGLTHRF